MSKLSLATVTTGYAAVSTLNSNFDAIETAVENTLSRNGTTPNQMMADIDLNGFSILNQGNAVSITGFQWRGSWITARAYAVGDVIENGGTSYVCITAHTSGTFATDLAASKWQLLATASLPTQTGNNGKLLTTNGSTASWTGAPLSIALGGTGATSAAAAITALGAIPAGTGAITFTSLQNEAAFTLLGNPTGSAASPSEVYFDGVTAAISAGVITAYNPGAVRQTILSAPVDSNGFTSPTIQAGTGVGFTTLQALGTFVASAASGASASIGALDYVGSVTNPTWSSLSTNGTMYLYFDIAFGVCTPGSTTLAPVYQWGGTYSTTDKQSTFNIQEMTMKVGNGASAVTKQRVFVGEVTVAAGVVSAIVWYQLNGRYDSGRFAVSIGSTYTKSHNIGVEPRVCNLFFAVSGGPLIPHYWFYPGAYYGATIASLTKSAATLYTTGALGTPSSGGGIGAPNFTEALIYVDRGW
jgi:hypothetical protein